MLNNPVRCWQGEMHHYAKWKTSQDATYTAPKHSIRGKIKNHDLSQVHNGDAVADDPM